MTKRDYQAIARAIHEAAQPGNPPGSDWACEIFPTSAEGMRQDIIGRIADVLAADNPRFDRQRFVEACETGRCKGMPR